MVSPLAEVSKSHRSIPTHLLLVRRLRLLDLHQMVWRMERERLQQDSVDDAEDRRIRTDSEGKRENCRYGEGWRPAPSYEGVADVLDDIFNHVYGTERPNELLTMTLRSSRIGRFSEPCSGPLRVEA